MPKVHQLSGHAKALMRNMRWGQHRKLGLEAGCCVQEEGRRAKEEEAKEARAKQEQEAREKENKDKGKKGPDKK